MTLLTKFMHLNGALIFSDLESKDNFHKYYRGKRLNYWIILEFACFDWMHGDVRGFRKDRIFSS